MTRNTLIVTSTSSRYLLFGHSYSEAIYNIHLQILDGQKFTEFCFPLIICSFFNAEWLSTDTVTNIVNASVCSVIKKHIKVVPHS